MTYQKIIFFLIVVGIFSYLFYQYEASDDGLELFLDKSVPYVGTNIPRESGFDGQGIKIAVIDTGVDYNHPDLLGFGPDGKVIGGYDYVDNDEFPIDTNGHGTEVAGIIAANGQLEGIAPKAKILAYRVSDNGESVSSELIIRAIEQAIIDDADVINISLGVNRTNQRIDDAVNDAVSKGIVVVTAAGNNGPNLQTIGSPGINPNTITVGATYNNITASLVSTLEVNEKQYQVLPMIGTNSLNEPITSEILFGKYGRERDLIDADVSNSILLVERGSDVEDELVYFSVKENNAATAGAKAVVVYNNQPGLYLGELIHEFSGPNYQPTIPALSMSNEDGVALREMLENKTEGTLDVFYNPDFVAHFSSRGPVSPFYIKPDLVAPGAFVNTTLIEGKYNFTSGTSFAAPHVAGAAALLLQKNQDFKPDEIKSLLVTTTDSVTDPYNNEFAAEVAGSGRLNVTRAFNANLIIQPTFLTFNLSPEKQTQTEYLQIKSVNQDLDNIEISSEENSSIKFDHKLENDLLQITASSTEKLSGNFQDKIVLEQNGVNYKIPVIVQAVDGSIAVKEKDGRLDFTILHPKDWYYAKISIINKETGSTDTTSATPTKDASLKVYQPGEYWIESKIKANETTFDAYETIQVKTTSNQQLNFHEMLQIPEKQILIIFSVAIIVALVGIKIRKK